MEVLAQRTDCFVVEQDGAVVGETGSLLLGHIFQCLQKPLYCLLWCKFAADCIRLCRRNINIGRQAVPVESR